MPDPSSWRALYPFLFLPCWRISGFQYHYLDEEEGPPLLMVHGNPTWSFYWRNQVAALRDRYRVIVPDHIGCGLSEKPPATQYDYRLRSRIDDLKALIEKLELQEATLLAYDWGGAVGMGAAVEMPDRFRRFVLCNTAAFPGGRCPWRIRVCRWPLVGALAVRGLNLFARAATFMAVAGPKRMAPQVRAGLLAPYDSWSHRIAVHRFVTDIPLHPSHPSYSVLQSIERGLSQFRNHPVCLIWGLRDWCFTSKFLDRFTEFFPNATVHRLAESGHYLLEDSSQEFTSLLREFLDLLGSLSDQSRGSACRPRGP